MNDVARLADVGTMTVSRVISGTVPVTEETRKRVQRAIDQLNYRPNELARAFRGQRTRSIGLILPYLYDPFFANCAHAVTTVAREQDYSVIITTSGEDPDREYAEVEQMLQRHVDGLMIIPAQSRQTRLTPELFGKTPVVAFDRPVAQQPFDVVTVQNSVGAQRMVEHLIEHGHKRIVFMGLNRRLYTMNARYLGYRKAMRGAGLTEQFFFGCGSQDDTLTFLLDALKGSISQTAIFTANTLATRYVLTALRHMSVRIPQDIALAGFDDFELADLTASPLTVVRQPAQEMGRVATTLLFERILRDKAPHMGSKIVLPVELILRRSCGCKHRAPLIAH
uniref:Transcriptional regulator, LacI family n=1 Tax=mine drainage metagenome TaxID=410659 RepID=E6PXF3_9ZZZZ